LPEKGRERIKDGFADLLAGKVEPWEYVEHPLLTARGEERLIAWHNTVLKDKNGTIVATLSSGEDITERKRAEAEREKLQAQFIQAQKMEAVGRLAGGVAHDFNNLAMGIMGYVQLCMDALPPDHRIREWLNEIATDTQRSVNLTRQLLAFARKQIVAPKVLDINDTIEGMLKLLRRLIGEDIDLTWLPGGNLWPIRIDPGQIDQIMVNLCVNARDAIAGVGKVTVETGNTVFDEEYCARHADTVPGEYVMLAVSDNGCGMNAETLSHMFEPFFTTKGVGKGTGLGLATVYGIVKQNHGFVNVSSEPGHGTSFRIYLPRMPGRAVAREAAPAGECPRGTETILLADDERSIRITVQAFLERLGYTVLAAETPEDALRLAAEHKGSVHLLITDVVMPRMSGRDLAAHVTAQCPGVKCLYMSGYTANVIAHQGVLDPGVHFLQKPVKRQALAAKIREVLGNG
jgi:signal transduction histidine kinase